MAVKNPQCPICGERFKDGRGLSGHVQWKHSLSGEERDEVVQEGLERGRREEQPASDRSHVRSVRDRELEIKGMLWEIEQRRTQLKRGKPSADLFSFSSKSKEVQSKLDELDKREEECREELRKITDSRETGEVPDVPPPEETDRVSTDDEELMESVTKADPQDA